MAFAEPLKLEVKRRAHFRCCLCHSVYVEIHHILPEAEGGPDTEENAAPLCPSCHETWGGNPDKRKFIREARDHWYEVCATRVGYDADQIREILADAIKGVATKEDLDRISVQNASYVLGSAGPGGRPSLDQLRYSFARAEFIHPRIVQELKGWISDPAGTIVAVDLVVANRSNRFFGNFDVEEKGDRVWVSCGTQGEEMFAYSYVATSPSGVHMVECQEWGGGSGVFGSILLFGFDIDRAIDQGPSGTLVSRERVLLKTLGDIVLGDRYAGEITYADDLLSIGPDKGWFNRGDAASKKIPIR